MRPQLDSLCNYCGSPEASKKCRDKLHEVENMLEREDPAKVCEKLGMCPPQPEYYVDFTGQF